MQACFTVPLKDLIFGPPTLQDYMKRIRNETVGLSHKGAPFIYNLPMEPEQIQIDGCCKRFSVGEEDPAKPHRTVLVLGQAGAGKSTLVNGMINYILGVKWGDSFRFALVEEDKTKSPGESRTSEVNVYKINHQEGFEVDFSLTVIDTPGFGDTRGIERDRLMVEQLNTLFTDPHGVSEIHAVCVVAPDAPARLTATQRYVFDSVYSIFGNDIAENIKVLVTFADGQTQAAPPIAGQAIKIFGVPRPAKCHHLRSNDAALLAYTSPGACDHCMETLFKALKQLPRKSLTLTKEVLRERQALRNCAENLQKQVSLGLDKIEAIRETTEILNRHNADVVLKTAVEAVVAHLRTEYAELQQEVVELTDRSGRCLDRLEEIALKPNPGSTPDYIDVLIRLEEKEPKPGHKDRIDALREIKRKEEFCLGVSAHLALERMSSRE